MAKERQMNRTEEAKGKKRKRKEDSNTGEEITYAKGVKVPQKEATGDPAQPKEVLSGLQRMDEETTTYLTEVKAHLDTLDDREEISLLAGNALEELQGKELKAATDAACSRTLEALVSHAAPEAFATFMNALTDGEEWCTLSARPFGSRVAETLLRRLEALIGEASDEDALLLMQQILTKITDVTVEHLYEFATDRNASHVARRLLCVFAGFDVMPAQHNSASMDASAVKANKGKGLAAKLESQLPAERKPVRHPELLEKVAFSLMQPNWDAQKAELLFHAYACPWLQALVKACAGEQDILAWLVPRLLGAKLEGDTAEQRKAAAQTEGLAGIAKEEIQGLMQDRTASHLLEVVMQVAPEWLLDQLHVSFLRGSLAALAMHPSGNFGVQAYLSALQTPQQVRGALRELRDSFTQLLRSRRAGVLAALLAAAGRAGNAALQVDAAKALLTATAGLQTDTAEQGPAAALLTLDCTARLGEQPGRARLSTLGAAMLSTMMRFDKDACAAFAESIAELAPAELLHMGMDPAGSRSLEAFLGSAVSAKAKKRVIRKLAGSYAKLGSSPGGSHVAQACYRTAGVKDKEVIAVELAAAEAHLGNTSFGQMLLRRCAIEEFKRSSDSWRSHAQTAAAMRNEFAELLADDDQPAQTAPAAQDKTEASKPKKRKTKAPAAAEQEVAAEPDIEHEKSGTKAKRKKTKAASAADAAAGASAASELDSCVETQKVQERASVLAETTLPDAGKEQIKKSKKQKAKQVPTALAPDGAEKVSQGKKAKKQKGVKI